LYSLVSLAGEATERPLKQRPKMPKVSGHSLNDSRFQETPAGDRVRSALASDPWQL